MLRRSRAIGQTRRFRRRCRGTTLIEVLVALTLVAVVMLGVLGIQFRAMALQKDSFDRRTAAVIVSDFGERVAGNFSGFEAGSYAMPLYVAGASGLSPPTCSGSCSPAQTALRDLASLQQQVSARLAGGAAWVGTESLPGAPDALRWVRVVVGWIDPQRAGQAVDALCSGIGLTDDRYRCFEAKVYP